MAKTSLKKDSVSILNDYEAGTAMIEAGVALGVAIINPTLSIPATALFSGFKALSALHKQKIIERQQEIKDNLDLKKVVRLMKDDPGVRDLIFELIERSSQEYAQEKRLIFYDYINNLTKKNNTLVKSRHYKLIYVITVIDIWEIDLLKTIEESYAEAIVTETRKAFPDKKMSDFIMNRKRGLQIGELLNIKGVKEKFDEDALMEGLQVLSSYGLIIEDSGRVNGTFYGPITQLGRDFLNWIVYQKPKFVPED